MVGRETKGRVGRTSGMGVGPATGTRRAVSCRVEISLEALMARSLELSRRGALTTEIVFEEKVFAGELVADGFEEGFTVTEVGDFDFAENAAIDLKFVEEGGLGFLGEGCLKL